MPRSPRKIVSVEYELWAKGGERIESSREPVRFVVGRGQVLPAIEELVLDLPVGGELRGSLAAKDAFGNEALLPLRELPRHELPDDAPHTVGTIFTARTLDGAPVRFKLVEVGDERVQVRFLHELSDVDIEYRIKVVDIQRELEPPPLPAIALGIDSAAIQIVDSGKIRIDEA